MVKSAFQKLLSRLKGLSRTGKRLILFSILFLLGLRAALPVAIKYAINRKIAGMDGLTGYVQDVDLAILLGRYQIEGIDIERTASHAQSQPHFEFEGQSLTIGLDWRQLFRGHVEMKIDLQSPRVDFFPATREEAKKKDKAPQLVEEGRDWREVIRLLYPMDFQISRLSIADGRVHYLDPGVRPKVDVYLDQIQVLGSNFTVVRKSPEDRFMHVKANGRAMKSGQFNVNVRIDPLAPVLQFDLDGNIQKLKLTELNDFLKAYGNFDVEEGLFSLFMEVAVHDKSFAGYLKPLYENLNIVEWGKDIKEGDLLQTFWEGIVGATAEILENQPRDRLATRIPFSGNFQDPNIGAWRAVVELLKNAFIRALLPKFDMTIDLKSVEKVSETKVPKT